MKPEESSDAQNPIGSQPIQPGHEARPKRRWTIFFATLALMTVVSAIIWQGCVAGTLYNCTDDNFLGYLTPGYWIHPPVIVVPVVHADADMSKPDTIKEGWSVAKLWCLWWIFVATSVLVSFVATSGRRRRS